VGRPLGADGVNDFKGQAGAVLKTAAVGIGALVGEGREELVEEIAMGGVDLDKVEACLEGTVRSLTKGLDCGVDAGLIKRLRNGIGGGKRHGAGRNGLPATLGGQEQALASADWGWERHAHAAFSSRMGQLNADAGALGVNEACYSRKGWDVLVLPDAEVAGRDAALRDDC